MEVSGQFNAPDALPARKEPPITHWRGGWMGPRAGLDAVGREKFFPFPAVSYFVSKTSFSRGSRVRVCVAPQNVARLGEPLV